MKSYQSQIDGLEAAESEMTEWVKAWAAVNTHILNRAGLETFSRQLEEAFRPLGADAGRIALKAMELVDDDGLVQKQTLADALVFSKRPKAKRRVLLVCHLDTVYPQDSPFRYPQKIEDGKLLGPGVCDAKGGIAVLLKALEIFERSPVASEIGWDVFLNPDEEAGSPGSSSWLYANAKKYNLGLVFEPCLPNGKLVGARKGSGNFTLVVRGRAAHAGREPHLGRNAIVSLAKFIQKTAFLNGAREGLSINAGIINGGRALNVVADLATVHFNVRVKTREDADYCLEEIRALLQKIESEDEVQTQLHGAFGAPPKALEGRTLALFEAMRGCAKEIGLDLDWEASGGVCDGNRLYAAGLANIDTMGPCGGAIHSPQEYLLTASLAERAKLAALFLMRWAGGEIEV